MRPQLLSLVTSVLLVLGVSLAVSSVLAASRTQSGTVSGRITDADSGTPVGGVEVAAALVATTKTDADGRYTLQNLPSGRISIQVGGSRTLGLPVAPRTVDVRSAVTLRDVNFKVRIPGTITGTVIDTDGTPVMGVSVIVVTAEFSKLGSGGSHTEFAIGGMTYRSVGSRAVTDDMGRYMLRNVGAGRPYRLLAYLPRLYTVPVSPTPSGSGPRPTSIVASYYPGVDTFDAAMPVRLYSLEQRSGADIRVRRADRRCLEGTLLHNGSAAIMEFALEEEEVGRLSDFNIVVGSNRISGQTGPDGRFRVCDLHAGRFRLVAVTKFPQVVSQPTPRGVATIDVGGEDLGGVVVNALDPTDVQVEIVPDRPEFPPTFRVRTVPTSMRMESQSTGFGFRLTLNGAINYSLLASGLEPPYYINEVLFGNAGSLASVRRRFIEPDPGAATGRLQVVVGSDGGTITGVVQAEAGSSAGAWFVVLPEGVEALVDVARELYVGISDDRGVVTTPALRPGRYRVFGTTDSLPGIIVLPSVTQVVDATPEALQLIATVAASGQRVEVLPRSSSRIEVKPRSLR